MTVTKAAIVQDLKIAGRAIGPGHPPFIIAELSGNHNGSLDRALTIVEAAAKTGVDALKIQTYTAETITLDIDEGAFFIENPESPWKGESLYKLYEKAHTPWEWHEPIMKRCRELGLICFSSPFDHSAVDFLEDLNVPAYKIASFEIVDLPLIRKAAATGKPLIMSTGMASLEEIGEAVSAARQAGCEELVLLKCTSSYPAKPSEMNLRGIPYLREKYGVQVGLSDHTMGIGVAVASVALGATIIEKHFTLSRADGGVDSAFSLEPQEMAHLVEETRTVHQALGEPVFGPSSESERNSLQFRRSLYVSADMQPGEVFTPDNLRSIRPGEGLMPKHYDDILGKKASRGIRRGTPMAWDLLES